MKYIWIFSGIGGHFPGGVFAELENAETWITTNKLTGVLTKYPVDQGVFDWALKNQMHGLTEEKLEVKKKDSEFIGCFTTASQEHYHYENGLKE